MSAVVGDSAPLAARPAAREVARPLPPGLLAAALIVGAAVALPAAYLLIVVGGDARAALEALWRPRTAELLGRSVALAAAVAAGATAIALPLAWLTVRSDLPGRRVWTVLTLLPFVVPSYIGAYLFVAAFGPRGLLQDALAPLGVERLPSIYGFGGAFVVLTLFTYPLVLLPARAALRRLDPALEEAARGMGASPWRVARTVVLPQLAPAVGAGAVLVALYALSDFGAVSILRFDSFTRVIHQSYRASFDRTGAAALAFLLVALMVALLAVEARVRRRGSYHRAAPGTIRPPAPAPLGRWRWPALAFVGALTAVTLVLPVAVLVAWAWPGPGEMIPWGDIGEAAGNSLLTAGLAATIAVVVALPAARLGARHGTRRIVRAIDGAHHAGYALPHLVVALSLVFFGIRVVPWAYQTLGMAVFALVVLYVPLALGSLRATLLQVPPSLEEAARGMGRGRLAIAATVLAPLTRAGIVAGAALVFLTAIKELPAMLLLAPTGFDTLATMLWQQANLAVYERAAVPALALLLVSVPPLALLVGRER